MCLLYPLDNGGVGHAATFAHGLHSVATAAALKFVHQRCHQSSAAGAERMTESNSTTVDVDLSEISFCFALPGQHHAGKSFIDFDAVHVFKLKAGAVHDFARCGNRSAQHEDWIFRGESKLDEARHGTVAQFFRDAAFHDQHGCGAVSNLRRVCGGYNAISLEDGLERGHFFQCGIGADGFIAADVHYALLSFNRQRQNLTAEPAFLRGTRGATMAFQAVLVEAFARELITLSQHFRADALAEVDAAVALHHRRTNRLAGTVSGGSAHGNTRHAFNAAADGDVIAAGDHALRGKMNGLLGGAALAIDGGAGNGLRKAGGEDSVACDIGSLLTDLHDAAGNHVVNTRGIKLVARDEAP